MLSTMLDVHYKVEECAIGLTSAAPRRYSPVVPSFWSDWLACEGAAGPHGALLPFTSFTHVTTGCVLSAAEDTLQLSIIFFDASLAALHERVRLMK